MGNRIQASCYSKCINKKFYEGDLSTGEGVCLDRCVSKFFATHQKMNDVTHRQNADITDEHRY
jgi:mitochondrial import inner membrane translocase subunit TIM10